MVSQTALQTNQGHERTCQKLVSYIGLEPGPLCPRCVSLSLFVFRWPCCPACPYNPQEKHSCINYSVPTPLHTIKVLMIQDVPPTCHTYSGSGVSTEEDVNHASHFRYVKPLVYEHPLVISRLYRVKLSDGSTAPYEYKRDQRRCIADHV